MAAHPAMARIVEKLRIEERELPNLPLGDALQRVHLYAERGSPKYEKAAMRWLERYLIETVRVMHFL